MPLKSVMVAEQFLNQSKVCDGFGLRIALYLPYEKQVGLTEKSINPDLYLALGISGAVHHIAGIRSSKTIIAVNSDKKAQIFDYADYGIVCGVEEIVK